MQEDGLTCQRYEEEHLYFSLPPAHPLSGSSGLHLRDLNGETMLLSSNIGFWRQLVDEKMADTHFLVQEEAFAFNELVKSSALPSFTTDLALQREERPQAAYRSPFSIRKPMSPIISSIRTKTAGCLPRCCSGS